MENEPKRRAKQRKYSIAEIDEMRQLIRWSYPSGVTYYAKERDADIENRLRTYMQNGTDPEELRKAAQEHSKREREIAAAELKWRVQQKEISAKARSEADARRHDKHDPASGISWWRWFLKGFAPS